MTEIDSLRAEVERLKYQYDFLGATLKEQIARAESAERQVAALREALERFERAR